MSALRDELQNIAALPADGPLGLSGRHYTDPAQFQHELETVLQRGWHCVGRADEVPQPGDFFTVQLLREPILVVRGADGRVRALANICRHRGMPLAEGRGNAKRFVCPYHAWAYGHDGALLRAPRMQNTGFDPKACRLPEHRLHQWNGFLYVSLDPGAAWPDLAVLETQLAPYETEAFRLAHIAEEVWACNWKSLVENFMEGYHLSVVHPETLHWYTPTGLAKKSAAGAGFTSYAANYPQGVGRGSGSDKLSDEQRQRSSLFAVFPTQVASQAANLLVSLSLFPLDQGRTRVKWTLSTFGDELGPKAIAERVKLWEEVNAEDREKLEKLQVALGSVHATAGPLAGPDYEGTIRDFHLWLAAQDRP